MQSENAAWNSKLGTSRFAGGKTYYISQLTAWFVYAAFLCVLSPPPRGARNIILSAVWCITGLLGTHFLRWYVMHPHWQTIPLLIYPFVVAALTMPAGMNGAWITVSTVFFHDPFEPTREWVVLAHYFQAVLVISIWCAVFVSANEVKRRRMAEMEVLQSALIAQVAQFRALRSQLNPHFLFNCLNSL